MPAIIKGINRNRSFRQLFFPEQLKLKLFLPDLRIMDLKARTISMEAMKKSQVASGNNEGAPTRVVRVLAFNLEARETLGINTRSASINSNTRTISMEAMKKSQVASGNIEGAPTRGAVGAPQGNTALPMRIRRKACGKCPACKRDKCGECRSCKNPKGRQKCLLKKCPYMTY